MGPSAAGAEPEPTMQMDRDAAGRVRVAPVTGFGLVLVAHSVCMLRVEFARSPDQLGNPEAVQLALSPVQARALADALLATACAGSATPANVIVN